MPPSFLLVAGALDFCRLWEMYAVLFKRLQPPSYLPAWLSYCQDTGSSGPCSTFVDFAFLSPGSQASLAAKQLFLSPVWIQISGYLALKYLVFYSLNSTFRNIITSLRISSHLFWSCSPQLHPGTPPTSLCLPTSVFFILFNNTSAVHIVLSVGPCAAVCLTWQELHP